MEKFKICPNCGAHNDPTAIECFNCEEDLTTVKIGAIETDKVTIKDDAASVRMVKVCYCGVKNPANARKCFACNEDISTVLPQKESKDDLRKFYLSDLNQLFSYELNEGRILVGREKEMSSFLTDKKFVSRTHAEIILERGKVYIRSLGTNHSFINNVQIKDKELIEIKENDILSFGGYEINGEKQTDAAFLKLVKK